MQAILRMLTGAPCRIAIAMFYVFAALGLAPEEARAQATDCSRYANILSALANAQSVSNEDIGWALDVERFNRCPASKASAAAPPAAPASTTQTVSQSYILREVPGPAKCRQGAPLNPTSNDPCDLYALAIAYKTGKGVPADQAKSADFMLRAAGAGNAQAQYRIGMQHMPEGNNPPRNPAQYLRWMRLAGNQGHVEAQENVAQIYTRGWGVPVNHAESARWNLRAMNGGSAWGATSLAVQYAVGEGVPLNRAKAAELYTFAAERGEPLAQYLLGVAYASEDGVRFDLQRARYWLQKSTAQNYDGAAQKLAEVDTMLARQSTPRAGRSYAAPAATAGPSLADQAMETIKRQRKENCAAAAAGRDRACIRD